MGILGESKVTTAAAKTEDNFDGVKSVLRSIWAAFLTAALTVSFVISFTTIIYGGSLAPLLETGLGLSLLGAALMCGVGGFFYSFRGTICHPQDVTAIVLAVSASAMAEAWPADQGDSLMATIAMLIAVTTAFSGLVAWGFGVLRLGFLARFIPYPVIGGFLAATGYLLLTGAIGLGLGARVNIWTLAPLLEPATLQLWLPWVLIGGGIALAARWNRSDLLLPLVLALALAGFYAILFATGMDLQQAEDASLLLGPFDTGGFVQVLTPSLIFDADPWAILRAAPTIMVVALLTVLGTLLNATGLELALNRDLDLEKDLRATGHRQHRRRARRRHDRIPDDPGHPAGPAHGPSQRAAGPQRRGGLPADLHLRRHPALGLAGGPLRGGDRLSRPRPADHLALGPAPAIFAHRLFAGAADPRGGRHCRLLRGAGNWHPGGGGDVHRLLRARQRGAPALDAGQPALAGRAQRRRGPLPHAGRPPGRGVRAQRLPVLRHRQRPGGERPRRTVTPGARRASW